VAGIFIVEQTILVVEQTTALAVIVRAIGAGMARFVGIIFVDMTTLAT
jgi:hypothetical protein